MTGVIPVFGSTLGKIFQPLFEVMAWLIAFFYALVPNYAVAIGLLTVVVMIVTAPLTVKSTRSMVAMQRLSPEIKKLQQKYKGDKQKLNEEMMNLYREQGVNPAGGCLPMVIQFPVFIILYDVIRGLTNTVRHGQAIASLAPRVVHCAARTACPDPRYISTSTRLYRDLVHSGGKMPAFGIDLAQRVFGHHTFGAALPYIFVVAVAIALQYLQMRQLNSRNPAAAQANPQAQMLQKYMPLIFAFIYLNIAAGVNIYFIVSTLCRIGIQEGVFRAGLHNPPPAETRRPGVGGTGGPRRRTLMERLADAQRQALEAQQARQAALQPGPEGRSDPSPRPPKRPETPDKPGNPEATDGGARRDQTPRTSRPPSPRRPPTPNQPRGEEVPKSGAKPAPKQTPKPGANGSEGAKPSTNGRRSPGAGSRNGSTAAGSGEAAAKTPHPRSRSKRNRKAR